MSVPNLGVGGSIPVVFTLGAELFPTRIRGAMVSFIARCGGSLDHRESVFSCSSIWSRPFAAAGAGMHRCESSRFFTRLVARVAVSARLNGCLDAAPLHLYGVKHLTNKRVVQRADR